MFTCFCWLQNTLCTSHHSLPLVWWVGVLESMRLRPSVRELLHPDSRQHESASGVSHGCVSGQHGRHRSSSAETFLLARVLLWVHGQLCAAWTEMMTAASSCRDVVRDVATEIWSWATACVFFQCLFYLLFFNGSLGDCGYSSITINIVKQIKVIQTKCRVLKFMQTLKKSFKVRIICIH